MDESIQRLLLEFVDYINAKHLMNSVDALVESAGISVQDACIWGDYDVMAYILACDMVEREKERFQGYYEALFQRDETQIEPYVVCELYRKEDAG